MITCAKCGGVKAGRLCKPCRAAYMRAYYASNALPLRARSAKYQRSAAGKATRAAHHDRHKARVNAMRRARYALSPALQSAAIARADRRRVIVLGASGSHTAEEWASVCDVFGHRCAYCLAKSEKLTKDHVIALSRGGSHDIANIVPSCQPCNTAKRDRGLFYMAP